MAYPTPNRTIQVHNLGQADYAQTWELQKQTLQAIVDRKVANRNRPPQEQEPTPNHLFLCQHPPVYTLGKSGDPANLKLSPEELAAKGIQYFPIERGGDITFHGPGQLVGYPVFDLENFYTDLNRYLRTMEEALIRMLAANGIAGERYPGYTGVWLEPEQPQARKIAAIGLKCSRWVSMHGFALNVNTDLQYFDWIVPCGISDKAVTSMRQELGRELDLAEVQHQLLEAWAEVFEAACQETAAPGYAVSGSSTSASSPST